MKMPTACAGVPDELLNPANTWKNTDEYDAQAKKLAGLFIENFKKYASRVSEEILAAAPLYS
jgi:phosphoenolpyruvate carboxykinase (ATP)